MKQNTVIQNSRAASIVGRTPVYRVCFLPRCTLGQVEEALLAGDEGGKNGSSSPGTPLRPNGERAAVGFSVARVPFERAEEAENAPLGSRSSAPVSNRGGHKR